MATLTLDSAQESLLGGAEDRPARAAPSAPSARTLDDLVTDVWSAIAATQTTSCPVCGGDLVPRFGAGAQPVAGACRSCGTELS